MCICQCVNVFVPCTPFIPSPTQLCRKKKGSNPRSHVLNSKKIIMLQILKTPSCIKHPLELSSCVGLSVAHWYQLLWDFHYSMNKCQSKEVESEL